MTENSSLLIKIQIAMYWKMQAFNHTLSSKRINIERVLGMIIKRFGIL
jgi:hypothetical protein